MSNEVECVLDACVAEPTQLEIDTDCFRAWTQGVAVAELLSSLKSALLEQYELDASASGSGYSALVQAQAAAQAQQAAQAAEEEERGGAWSDDDEAAPPKMRHPHSLPTPATTAARGQAGADDGEDDVDRAVTEHLRRAQAADSGAAAEAGGSSSDEERARIRRKLGANASRRNSATASVSGKHPAAQSRAQLKGSSTAAARSTPSALPRSSGFSAATASASPSPLPVDLLGELPPSVASIAASSLPSAPPDPSAIDLDSSSQAMSRLLWAWESQLEHQWRLFSLLEHALKKPFLLSVHYSVLQLSFQMQLQLTNLYYDFDRGFMRQLLGLKLSTKTRGNISDMLSKIKQERVENQEEGARRPEATAAATAAAYAARRNSQSSLLGAPPMSGLNALLPSADSDYDLASSLAAVSNGADDSSSLPMSSGAGSGGDPVRFSSCCRQFDNLRRIYRARWGEKGDGETDLRLDDFDAGISLLHSSIRAQAVSASMPGGAAAAKKDDVLSERWRAMRAAAAAAMAKRGFGSDKNAAATPASASAAAAGSSSSSATAAAAAANMRAQQWMLRHFDAAAGSAGSLLSGGVALGGGLDDFFGLDRSSLAMRPGEQTLPLFIQQQFRLHSSLACLYSRMIFLAHYRIGVSITVKRKKKQLTLLSFDEQHLIAQILMRCWCVPVGSASAGTTGADDVAPSLEDPRAFSTSPAGSSSLVSVTAQQAAAGGGASSDPPTLSRLATTDSTTAAAGARRGSLDDPSVAIYDLSPHTVPPSTRGLQSASNFPSPAALRVDNDGNPARAARASAPAAGAACAGYDFLPIVSAIRPGDEECWVGDVLDSDFLSGLAELKTVMGSNRFMEEYATTLGRMMRDTIQLQVQITQQQLKAGTVTQGAGAGAGAAGASTVSSAAAAQGQSGSIGAGAAAAAGSDSASHSLTSSTQSSASILRSSVLLKLQSRLPALLKSLHALAVNLPKSKRLRTLLSDLLEEVLRPLLKLGASSHELLYFMRAVREAIMLMPSIAHLQLEREAVYPHAYERKERAERAAAAAAAAAEAEQPTPSQQSRSIAAATVASAGSQTPAGSSAAASARLSQDPMRRALVRWCRFLDAIGPCSVILYINLSHSQEAQ